MIMWFRKEKTREKLKIDEEFIYQVSKRTIDLTSRVGDLEQDIESISILINSIHQEIFATKQLMDRLLTKNIDAIQLINILNKFRDEDRGKID